MNSKRIKLIYQFLLAHLRKLKIVEHINSFFLICSICFPACFPDPKTKLQVPATAPPLPPRQLNLSMEFCKDTYVCLFVGWFSFICPFCLGLKVVSKISTFLLLVSLYTFYLNSYSENPNKMQHCINILLFLILNKLNIFWATRLPSSGA
jgi:hypothetical protein